MDGDFYSPQGCVSEAHLEVCLPGASSSQGCLEVQVLSLPEEEEGEGRDPLQEEAAHNAAETG